MNNKKKLYWNSCSFLYADIMFNQNYILSEESLLSKLFFSFGDGASFIASAMGSNNESIFLRTLIDCSKNNFDFVLIGWSHPERALILNNHIELDFEKLKEDSEKQFLGNSRHRDLYGYQNLIPTGADYNNHLLKFEPKGTDDTILYTISLHNFFKQKGIPHLFLNMGKLDSNVLSARESWLNGIDPKNYLSINDNDNILEKMTFSFTEYYAKKAEKMVVKDSDIHKYNILKGNSDEEYAKTGWIMDIGGHLGKLAYNDLFNLISNHIQKNNLV